MSAIPRRAAKKRPRCTSAGRTGSSARPGAVRAALPAGPDDDRVLHDEAIHDALAATGDAVELVVGEQAEGLGTERELVGGHFLHGDCWSNRGASAMSQ